MGTPHRYRISPHDPGAHLFEVRLTVANPDPDGQVFAMPAWIPGSYMIRDYARNVVAIRAESDGLDVPLEKLDKSCWRAAPVQKPLTLVAEIYGYDLSVRGAHLDNTHAWQTNGVSRRPCAARTRCRMPSGPSKLTITQN
jgi:predicted metalloprotease with PDZ domain